MSLDYPNRNEWLARRATPAKLPAGRMIHVSAPLVTSIDPVTGKPRTVIGRGITLNIGRNQQKRNRKARASMTDAELDAIQDASIAANAEFDAMKREQEVAA